MARGRRGTMKARVTGRPAEMKPRWEPVANEADFAIGTEHLAAEARKDLAYAYVSLSEALATVEGGPRRESINRARKATAVALLSIGVDPETDQIIQDCLA